MFSEMCKEMMSREGAGSNMEIFPCVNAENPVEVYRSIPRLSRLAVKSEEELLGKLDLNVSFVQRVKNRRMRNRQYAGQIRSNIAEMKAFIASHQIDCVVIHNGGYVGDDLCNQLLEAAYEAKVARRIMVFHSDFHKSFLRKLWCARYDRMINRCATQTVTVSEFTRKRLLDNSFLNKNMEVIYNGLSFEDQEDIDTKKEKLSYIPGAIHLGMVGNFSANKGQLEMLKSVNAVRGAVPHKLQVFLIGNIYDQEYYEKCVSYLAESGLQDIVGIHQGIHNAGEYYELFDVTIVPSLYDESFGLISVESMRAGVPVVAFACGGIPEVVKNGVDGFVVEVGNVDLMAEAIVKILSDDSLAKELGRNAKRDYHGNFSRSSMGDKYVQLINGL